MGQTSKKLHDKLSKLAAPLDLPTGKVKGRADTPSRIRSRAEGDKRAGRLGPRRWRSLANGRAPGGPARNRRAVVRFWGDFLHQLSVPKAPRFRVGHNFLKGDGA